MLNNTTDPKATTTQKQFEESLMQEYMVDDYKDLVERLVASFRFRCCELSERGLGLLVEIYRKAAGDSVNQKVLEILSQHEECKYRKDILTEDELVFLAKHIDEVFRIIISSEGLIYKPVNGFKQPQEIIDFICDIIPKDVTVYNPFAGDNSCAITLSNHIVGVESDPTTWALGQIHLFAKHVDTRTEIELGSSFDSIQTETKYPAIITSPLYTQEKSHEIADIVNKLYGKLNDGGTLVCLVPAEFLSSQSSIARTVRKKLINEKAVRFVCVLPSVFVGISEPQAAIVLQKGTDNGNIIFADASGYTRYSRSIYRETIFERGQFMEDLKDDLEDFQEPDFSLDSTTVGIPIFYNELVNFNLLPSTYLTPKPDNGIALSELAVEVPELKGKERTAEYSISNFSIPEAMHRTSFIPTKGHDGKSSTSKKYVVLPKNAVVVAIAGGNIRTVYIERFNGKVSFSGESIKILQPKEGISARYLAALLATDIVVDQIKAQASITPIPKLNNLDLSQIIVPHYDTTEEQEQLMTKVLSREMDEYESEQEKKREQREREIRSTRHAMIQTLSTISSNWEVLNMFVKQQDGQICMSDIIGRNNPISVAKLMGNIGYSIITLQKQVDSLLLDEKWGQPVAIYPSEFIRNYIRTHETPNIQMILGNEDEKLFCFSAPQKLLERIFDNIVANAKAHGFTQDQSNKKNIIRFDWEPENGNIAIKIANNGAPLKSGVSGSDVLMNGFSTALHEELGGTPHSGLGGFEIKSLMEGLGSVEVISLPNNEYPVIYKLIFFVEN